MSYGLPVVTTEIGAEGIGLEDGKTGLIARDAFQFAKRWSGFTQTKIYGIPFHVTATRYVAEHFSQFEARDFFSKLFRS